MLNLIYIYFFYLKECFIALLYNTRGTFHPTGSGIECGNYAFFSTLLHDPDRDMLNPEYLHYNFQVHVKNSAYYPTNFDFADQVYNLPHVLSSLKRRRKRKHITRDGSSSPEILFLMIGTGHV